jgi:undecaprenyl-diphosphatase
MNPGRAAAITSSVARAVILAGVLLAVAVALGLVATRSWAAADAAIAATVVAACPPWLATLGDLIGSLPVVAAVTALLAAAGWVRGGARMAAALAFGITIEVPVQVVKVLVDRPRPPGANEIEAFGSIASYPSGHEARVVVLSILVVGILLRGSRFAAPGAVIGAVVVVLVGIARVGAGVHWPTDVIGGILVGAAWAMPALAWAGGRSVRSGPDGDQHEVRREGNEQSGQE